MIDCKECNDYAQLIFDRGEITQDEINKLALDRHILKGCNAIYPVPPGDYEVINGVFYKNTETMNGFKIGETGYGFSEDGIYSYVRTMETDSMANLFKTRKAAIEKEIKETEDYLIELREMLNA